MRISRFPSLTESEFRGCNSAFVDALFGELGSTSLFLAKLDGQPKGSAFAFEMELDRHRYGAMLVLERWADLVDAFGDHLQLSRHKEVIEEAPARVQTAENLLGRMNRLIDESTHYTPELAAACGMALDSLRTTFRQERAAAQEDAELGPLLPEQHRQARRVFLADLGER